MECTLCPRNCRVERETTTGFCGQTTEIRAVRAALHFGEEPCISGKRGSGTVFFSGCTLKCVFCQNYDISSGKLGYALTPEELSRVFLALSKKDPHNINLVTPTQFLPGIRKAMELSGGQISLPLLCNCGGYERVKTVEEYADLFSVWMPDLKFCDSTLSARYLRAPDYFETATKAIVKMREKAGPLRFDGEGMLSGGILIRHLVMPGCMKDSLKILDWICANFGPEDAVISLMSQYLPWGRACEYPEINRRVTSYEYKKAEERLSLAGFPHCYTQSRTAATPEYIPEWNGEGIKDIL